MNQLEALSIKLVQVNGGTRTDGKISNDRISDLHLALPLGVPSTQGNAVPGPGPFGLFSDGGGSVGLNSGSSWGGLSPSPEPLLRSRSSSTSLSMYNILPPLSPGTQECDRASQPSRSMSPALLALADSPRDADVGTLDSNASSLTSSAGMIVRPDFVWPDKRERKAMLMAALDQILGCCAKDVASCCRQHVVRAGGGGGREAGPQGFVGGAGGGQVAPAASSVGSISAGAAAAVRAWCGVAEHGAVSPCADIEAMLAASADPASSSVFVMEVHGRDRWTIVGLGAGAACLKSCAPGGLVGHCMADFIHCRDILRLEQMWPSAPYEGEGGMRLPVHRVWVRCSARESGHEVEHSRSVGYNWLPDEWDDAQALSTCYRQVSFASIALMSSFDERALLLGYLGASQHLPSCHMCGGGTCEGARVREQVRPRARAESYLLTDRLTDSCAASKALVSNGF
jgi:hypothetical protein